MTRQAFRDFTAQLLAQLVSHPRSRCISTSMPSDSNTKLFLTKSQSAGGGQKAMATGTMASKVSVSAPSLAWTDMPWITAAR